MNKPFLLFAILVLLIVGAGVGLVLYAGGMDSPNEPIETVVPDSNFPK